MAGPSKTRAASPAGIAKRKAFQKPSQKRLQQLKAQLDHPDYHKSLHFPRFDSGNTNMGYYITDLIRGEFNRLHRDGEAGGVHKSVVVTYIRFVCEYVNRHYNRHTPGSIPVCTHTDGEFFKDYLQAKLSFLNIVWPFRALDECGASRANFFQLRHIFLPDRSVVGHISLIVISPQSRTVDILDSTVFHGDDMKAGVVFGLIREHIGDLFIASEWRVRFGHSPDQGQTFNCGIFTMTNVMFVALGYPTVYSASDMAIRRKAIAAELLCALNDGNLFFDYEYPVTDYWTRPESTSLAAGFHHLTPLTLSVVEKCWLTGKGRP